MEIGKVRKLTEQEEDLPEPEEGKVDYDQIAKQVVTMIPDMPKDQKEAQKYVMGLFKKLSRSPMIVARAIKYVHRPGKEKQILRKAITSV
jgi:hypothetical protein